MLGWIDYHVLLSTTTYILETFEVSPQLDFGDNNNMMPYISKHTQKAAS